MGSGSGSAAAAIWVSLWPPVDLILPMGGGTSILSPIDEMAKAMQDAWHHRMGLVSLGLRVKMGA